jgi:epoxyqueuosine reductase QueG
VEELVKKYPFTIVCAVGAHFDPAHARGMGGQFAIQRGAVLAFNLAAYIRELGYAASVRHGDSTAVAVAAGLGNVNKHGRFIPTKHRGRVWLTDLVLTNLPLAPDAPLS